MNGAAERRAQAPLDALARHDLRRARGGEPRPALGRRARGRGGRLLRAARRDLRPARPRRTPRSSWGCSRICSRTCVRRWRASPTKWPRSRSRRPKESSMLGLVLTAGGARGAYQAGVLKRLGELPVAARPALAVRDHRGRLGRRDQRQRCSRRAARASATPRARSRASGRSCASSDVFRSDALLARAHGRGGSRSTSRSAACSAARARHGLLDTAPLAQLARALLPAARHRRGHPPRPPLRRRGERHQLPLGALVHLRRRAQRPSGLAEEPPPRAAGDAHASTTCWRRPRSRSCSRRCACASQAGELWFGDGGLRLVTPLSPAIRLGATRLLSIGVRSQRAADALAREEAGAAASADEGRRSCRARRSRR